MPPKTSKADVLLRITEHAVCLSNSHDIWLYMDRLRKLIVC